jgi:signal peptidase II
MSPRPAHWVALAAVAVAALAADQGTKALVRSTLGLGDTADGVGPFSLLHTRNSGILGGRLEGTALVMGIVTLFVIAGILLFFARTRRPRPATLAALGLLVGGSVGNLVDRLRLGYVTDFITRDGEKAFNVADVSIFLGIAIVGAAYLFGKRPPEPDSVGVGGPGKPGPYT